jgi:5-hydroxyisourate hydrolase-like protein (transthyretin family)
MRTAPPPVANIVGTVTGFGGVALAGATVTMTNPSQGTTTDSVGEFLFSNLLSGTYELTLQAAGYFDTTISNISHNAPTATNLTIAMRQIPPPTASILGLVTDSAGNPLEGVGISLVSPSESTSSIADGSFGFAGLVSGSYQIVMVLNGYADTTIENVVIDAPTNTNVTVTMRKLPPVGAISGVVTDQVATPLANVTVQIESLSLSTTTDGAGQYAFDDLLSGVYDLKFTAAGYYDSTVTSVVHTAPTTTTVSLSLRAVPPPVGTIRGTVRNTSGAEMVGVAVQLVSPALSTTTDVTGQFAFAGLFSGLYSVRFSASGYVDTTVSGITLSAPYDYSKVVIMRPASLVPVADAYEPNNSLNEVAGKVFGGYRSPNLGPVGPLTVINSLSIHSTTSDYYRFTTNATGTSADFIRLNFLHSQGDIDVALLTTTNTQLSRSAGSGNTEQISLNNLAKGTYVIRVYGYNGAKNPNYSLTLDVPSNQAPTITATLPVGGNVNLLQGSSGRVGWTFSDPETDPCYVSLFLNSSPTLDGNQLPMTAVQNSSASVGELIFSTASVPVGTYYAYLEITDGGQKSGSWAPGTFTITNSGATATLAGIVTNQSSIAIRGATVTLINPAMSTTTDSLGQFAFTGLLSGVYTARVKAMDYFDTTVTNLVITAPTTTNALIAMNALPRESDNFADADFSNWTAVNTGVWSAVAGGLKGNGDNLDAVLQSPFAQYGACELTASMKMSIYLDRKARLIFSYIDANNYRFIEGDESNDRWRIGERVNGVNTIQASVIAPILNDTWYTVRASVGSTGLVTLWVNYSVITSWQFASVVNGRVGVGYSRGNVDFDDVTVIGIPTAPAPESGGPDVNNNGLVAAEDGLLQNYPNPFNPVTQISFSIASTQRVRLTVFNILGEVVRELVNEEIGAGVHSIEWDGTSANGHSVASGVYFYQLITEKATQSKKMMLVK